MFWSRKPQKKKAKAKVQTVKPVKASQKPKPYIPPPRQVDIPKPVEVMAEKPIPPAKPKQIIDHKNEFLRIFKELTYRHRAWDIWNDFVVMAACALSNPVDKFHYDEREARYLRIIKKYNKNEQNLFPELFAHTVMALERNPEQDFLGEMYTSLNLHDNWRQQHFTPYSVCTVMSEITMGDIVEQVRASGYVTLNDCCCGAGATLIAGVNTAKRKLEKVGINFQNHILVAAQDIDETVALMCYIQLSLLGVAAYINVGNALTEPMTVRDTLENYWFSPMYFSNVWTMRRAIHKIDDLLKGENK